MSTERACKRCGESIIEDGDSNWTHVSDGARFCNRASEAAETVDQLAEPAEEDWRQRQTREHYEKYAKLAKTLGEDSIERLVAQLVPRCAAALAAGDEHLNTIQLGLWDKLADVTPDGVTMCCGKRRYADNFCPDCGKKLRKPAPPAEKELRDDWPYAQLRETARDDSKPWHKAPGLSLAERVCVLKYTARRLALAYNARMPAQGEE